MTKIAFFGDSIAAGLGVRGRRYPELVASAFDFELVDYSVSGSTVRDSRAMFSEKPIDASYAVIAHGITEPIYRPVAASLRVLPRRWQRRGWMDPRPYYSRRWRKRGLEKIESSLRWRVKNLLMRAVGSEQLLSEDEYVSELRGLCSALQDRGVKIAILGPPPIDDRFFPKSSAAQKAYAARARELGVPFLALEDLCKWTDFFADHFHPNESGHMKISLVVSAWLAAEGSETR